MGSLAPQQLDVARELVRYGRELAQSGAAQVGATFTDDSRADALIKRNPNAFLIGVLFTQGIPAERAWVGPFLLAQRLGGFDLAMLARDTAAVRAAFQQPPMLHRFKETLPRWISSAAQRLLDEYAGDASRIWADGSHVIEVTQRLAAFDGIGRKKAAMAVEIVMRHFGAKLAGIECGSVAYDVHVRRVFLRSGLVADDTPDAVVEAAALACPEAPGTLDLPTWLIGRETCRPKSPRCDACRIGDVCARMTWLDAKGVGHRESPNPAAVSRS